MANTWNQALTTWGQNTWGKQADVTPTGCRIYDHYFMID